MVMVLRPGQPFDDLVGEGNTACPRCRGALSRWGRGRPRAVRRPEGEQPLRPPRARCRACGVTQVVLPPEVLVRRRDSIVTVGLAWRRAVEGAGVRRIGREAGVPPTTVRGWLRRLRSLFGDRYGGPPEQHRERLRRGLQVVTGEAGDAGCRADPDVWAFVTFRSQGLLLATNTNWP